MALMKLPTITNVQVEFWLRMGAPPVSGKPVIIGKRVAVAGGATVGGVPVTVTVDVGSVGGVPVTVAVGIGPVSVAVGIVPVTVAVGIVLVSVAVGIVPVSVAVAVNVAVGCAEQNTGVMVLSSSVTAAFNATALPARLALLFIVIL
jgi:hypothetical protein